MRRSKKQSSPKTDPRKPPAAAKPAATGPALGDGLLAPEELLRLQRTHGNAYVQRLVQRSPLQDRIGGGSAAADEERTGSGSGGGNALTERITGAAAGTERHDAFDEESGGAGRPTPSFDGNRDGYQLVSHTTPGYSNLLASIYFPTGNASVVGDDLAVIRQLAAEYYGLQKPWHTITVVGFADNRPYKNDPDHAINRALMRARADRVRDELVNAFGSPPSLPGRFAHRAPPRVASTASMIILDSPEYSGNQANDANLAYFRRADIILTMEKPGAPEQPEEPQEPQPADPEKRTDGSFQWLVRVRQSASGAEPGGAGGEWAEIEIVSADPAVEERGTFRFKAVNYGFGNILAAYGGATDWERCSTNKRIHVQDFAGTAEHTNIQAEYFGVGGSHDTWRFWGPLQNAGAQPAWVEFSATKYPGSGDGPFWQEQPPSPIPQGNLSNTTQGKLTLESSSQ